MTEKKAITAAEAEAMREALRVLARIVRRLLEQQHRGARPLKLEEILAMVEKMEAIEEKFNPHP